MPQRATPESPVLVSACLLGVACNHVGAANPSPSVQALLETRRLIPICPETAGGLPTPRPAAELRANGSVWTDTGRDVTDAFMRGATAAVELAKAGRVTMAVLKARSPSCGCSRVYDGTFTRTLVDREGVTAAALRHAGVVVLSEEDISAVGSGRPDPAGSLSARSGA